MQKEVESNVLLCFGTYPPRECGIATFTKDLTDSIDKKFFPYLKTQILAINNNGVNIYNYPKKVIYQLSDTEKISYKRLATKINQNNSIKIVSIQHEFGIFGGEYGEYLIDFLKELKKPKIITFHSILPFPDEYRKRIVQEISANVDEIIAMSTTGIEILRKNYEITTPIKFIPHGIPTVSFENQSNAKKHLGYQDKIVFSSFGMISQGKGCEYVIEALPEIIKRYPNVIYLIVGATHPIVRKEEGEKYRNYLDRKVKALNLQNHVKFYNKYIKLKEIIEYLKATDIYISSTLTPEQVTSGTLSYALGCGRAAISTPFLHAKDLLKDGRGIILPDFKNEKSFANAILQLLQDKKARRDMEQNSYEFTRPMTWSNVALSYGNIIKNYVNIPEIYFEKLPRLNTRHIRKMTDNFGMMQFARYSIPKPNSGYTLDDNSRALIVSSKLYTRSRNISYLNLMKTYLKYIKYVQTEDGRFYNSVSKTKSIDKNSWSEEAHGRAMRALGFLCSAQSIPKEIRNEAESLLLKSLRIASEFHAPRAISYATIGLCYYNKENYSEEIIKNIKKFAECLANLYKENKSGDWLWFEPVLTYSNSTICEALFYSYIATQEKKYMEIALESLNFIISKTFENNLFVPIGQNGWYKKGGQRAYFDQQPLDVSSMVESLSLAYKLTRNPEYEKKALTAFQWFLGKNMLNQVVYDHQTGGCYDGLDKSGLNLNQGAESTLAYLTARLEIEDFS